ncbi:hypothetical protein OVA03_14430 [Asticcacaulis sp. SL142]|uniref:hypothetical protein n=1 Tax=Asticcacaulis sp. SL142 TaxID=2995155 RepID=UPI00226CC1B9|nr:hypothetical protein [Asticcacaulis sp. SL142]WAC47885.1 hypothetical protein OVA03_14430 [Asticcacaulis sp. SL142]
MKRSMLFILRTLAIAMAAVLFVLFAGGIALRYTQREGLLSQSMGSMVEVAGFFLAIAAAIYFFYKMVRIR